MIFPVEIFDIIAHYNWRAWGVLKNTCKTLNNLLIHDDPYEIFAHKVEESNLVWNFLGAGNKQCSIGYRSYGYETNDNVEIKYVYINPEPENTKYEITYPLIGVKHIYHRYSKNRWSGVSYTHEFLQRAGNGYKKLKLAPITKLEWDKLIEGL
ncbi:hypothetical protein E24_00313 [Faustovirus]|nr:hypothetical protein PRJ_Fausto_00295 [Faustovirus]AMN83233.1 hypothetical protein E24_00313 [Faustovirus]AMN84214.1 hypothetical protein D5a_00310 [Faustovirus]AMN85202.1 hypothetical protein E23_00312 [Faustovirus]QBR99203.1 hypothetical protein [Faustovirus mariensis]